MPEDLQEIVIKPPPKRCIVEMTDLVTTAAVTKAKVWVLDRRVFQAIMMKTGLQRQEENIQFLRR